VLAACERTGGNHDGAADMDKTGMFTKQ